MDEIEKGPLHYYCRDTGRGFFPTYHDVPEYVPGRDGPEITTEEEWLAAMWKAWEALQERSRMLEPILERQEQARQRLFTITSYEDIERAQAQEENDVM